MSDVFPEWMNRLPRKVFFAALAGGIGVTAAFGYYFTPKYSQSGYTPVQPVGFSHKTHVGQVGTDCRYCHNGVEKSWFANLPDTSACMNCHGQILKDDPRLALVRESSTTGKPIPWVHVQRTPDFVYFSHVAHVKRGIGCVDCHGRVDQMDEIQAQAMSMTFCLDCHRNPAQHLRPSSKMTQLDWLPSTNLAQGQELSVSWKVQPRDNCGSCHR